jgi:hypothetical protein
MTSVYKIIRARTLSGLTKKVNMLKAEGWMVDGAVYTGARTVNGKKQQFFRQALTQGVYAFRPEQSEC